MRIGFDLDNTIISYDALIRDEADGRGLLPPEMPADKRRIRDYLREQEGGELCWREIQAVIYGKRLQDAVPFAGVLDCFLWLRDAGVDVWIVSHKTRRSRYDSDRHNLREAALVWLAGHGFFDGLGMAREQVLFGSTRGEKVALIREVGPLAFVDDLPETFREAGFPQGTKRILFGEATGEEERACRTWSEITALLKQMLA